MSKNFKEFVETLEILKDVQCFWGKMSREEAKQILADKPIGSYLIFEIIVIDENRGIQNFEMIEKCKYPRQSALVMGSKLPVNRNRPFSLKELCRLQILQMGITEDGITKLEVPEEMKIFFR